MGEFFLVTLFLFFFFFKQKTAYEMSVSDWSSDVCSSDLRPRRPSDVAGPDPSGPEAMMAYAAFFVVAAMAVVSALGLVLKRNAIHGALFLIVNLGSIAVLYQTLGAEFLAWAQVIVYAGAIMVLFVFAIMVLIPGKEETGPDPRRPWRLLALPAGALLFVQLIFVVGRERGGGGADVSPAGGG